MVPAHMPRARPKMHLAVLKLSSAPRQPGWKWYHHTRWARDGSLGSTRFWLFANWSCKSKSEVFSRDTEERYSLFSKDGLKASGWSESVFNVLCYRRKGVISPCSCLPATVEIAKLKQVPKSSKPVGRMMPWFTSLVRTLLMRSDLRFAILCWPITFLPINGHQASCPAMWVSKQKDDQATQSLSICKNLFLPLTKWLKGLPWQSSH